MLLLTEMHYDTRKIKKDIRNLIAHHNFFIVNTSSQQGNASVLSSLFLSKYLFRLSMTNVYHL